MSVDVKTPTRTPFEQSDFRHGGPACSTVCSSEVSNINMCVQTAKEHDTHGDLGLKHDSSRYNRRRRHSERGGLVKKQLHARQGKSQLDKERKPMLPRKFLLGGNINDPLNLNSLCDEEVDRTLNAVTPQSSPLPVPLHRQQVKLLIPPNITDPLNLNAGEDADASLLSPKAVSSGGSRKKRMKAKKKGNLSIEQSQDIEDCAEAAPLHVNVDTDTTTNTEDAKTKIAKVVDTIVSPVVPQSSPKSRKRKRLSSECRPDISTEDCETPVKAEKISPYRPKYKKQSSNQQQPPKFKEKNKKFVYGNYNRYYGYRNPNAEEDIRLKCIKKEWIQYKDVLDIGCNVGHLTLALTKQHQPANIVGMDIDSNLIRAARKNVRHYLSVDDTHKFPVSLPITYGPLAAPAVSGTGVAFPNNISFVQGNYVLDRDELVELQVPEYDVILALSLTKWLHLNFGDAGLKRAFRRMYAQLRPGGMLVLEPQSWASYKKKKKLSETIFKNFQHISFKPDQFTEYLLSRECGFATCDVIGVPHTNTHSKAKGFQRPLLLFTKADFSGVDLTDLEQCPTPLMQIDTCRASLLNMPGMDSVRSQGPAMFYAASDSMSPANLVDSPSKGNTPRFFIGSASCTPTNSVCDTPHGRVGSSCATPVHRIDSSGFEASAPDIADLSQDASQTWNNSEHFVTDGHMGTPPNVEENTRDSNSSSGTCDLPTENGIDTEDSGNMNGNGHRESDSQSPQGSNSMPRTYTCHF